MGRALKYLFRLAVLAFIGLVAYAYLADLPPPTRQVELALPVPAGAPGEAQPEPAAPAATTPAAHPTSTPAAGQEQEPAGIMQE